MGAAGSPASAGRPRRRLLRTALKLCLAVVASLLLIELCFRFLLFHDSGLARRLGQELRQPAHFATRWTDEYWKLRYLFAPQMRRPLAATARPSQHDPVLGWIRQDIQAGTYAHQAREHLAGRRPVLLYGDSFAACVTASEDCWEGLLSRSELADEFLLLNHGTGGYGLDQTVLLFQQTIEQYLELDPVVVISLLVDVNLDRSVLSFREWPKPHFSIGQNGELELDGPVPESAADFLDEHPLGIRSYAWRYVVHGTGLLPDTGRAQLRGREAIREHTQNLNRPLLEALAGELEDLGLDYFVLLFHGKKTLYPKDPKGSKDWREPYLLAELERLGMPYISAKALLQADARTTGRGIGDYFLQEGGVRRHYTPLANGIVFEAFRRGIAGHFDGGVR